MPNFVRQVPVGDNREREVCAACGHVAYENPKIVVGAVVADRDRVLLCRRAIEPRAGFWTLPAGYLELGETAEEGAIREASEEALADIVVGGVLALYSISRIGQVQIIYTARFAQAEAEGVMRYGAGSESLEVGLFAWSDIPWDELAFPSVRWALRAWHDRRHAPLCAPATNPTEDPRGSVQPPEMGVA